MGVRPICDGCKRPTEAGELVNRYPERGRRHYCAPCARRFDEEQERDTIERLADDLRNACDGFDVYDVSSDGRRIEAPVVAGDARGVLTVLPAPGRRPGLVALTLDVGPTSWRGVRDADAEKVIGWLAQANAGLLVLESGADGSCARCGGDGEDLDAGMTTTCEACGGDGLDDQERERREADRALGAAVRALYVRWAQDDDEPGELANAGSAADQCAELYEVLDAHGLVVR